MRPLTTIRRLVYVSLGAVTITATATGLMASMQNQGAAALNPAAVGRDLMVHDSSDPPHRFPLIGVSAMALPLPDRWVAVQIRPDAGFHVSTGPFFTEPGCQGTPYMDVRGVPPFARLHPDGFTVTYPDGPVSAQDIMSFIDEDQGDACIDSPFVLETAAPAAQFDLRDAGLTTPITAPYLVSR